MDFGPTAMQTVTTAIRLARYRMTNPIWRLLAVALVIAVIYVPDLAHHYVPQPQLPPTLIARLTAEPSGETLDAIAERGASLPLLTSEYDPREVAQQILAGTFTVPQFQAEPILLLDYPEHLRQGPPTLRLVMASLELERLLLEAHGKVPDTRLLSTAVQRIAQFDRHERSRWLPDQFLWNDHALAARAGVLALAWKHARTNSEVPESTKLAIVRQAARTGALLANDAHFTIRTNHGVMQNLALLQLGTAFPSLPESMNWVQRAKERLDLQLAHYVSAEGMVLEHSATYQQVGAELLARFVDILALRGEQPSPSLRSALNGSVRVVQELFRPDGSLPLLGNTAMSASFAPALTGPSLVRPKHDEDTHRETATLMPISGYAIWHAGEGSELSQTVIAWAKHDGHGHKHADELSVHFWRNGIDWLTATGYWPYGRAGAEAAYGWRGSNAPHQRDEAFDNPRHTTLLAHAAQDRIKAIDLERKGPGHFAARRQVVQIDDSTLFVLDFTSAGIAHQTVWTFDPRLTVSQTAQSAVNRTHATAASPETGWALHLDSQGEGRFEKFRGSLAPFAGWVVVDREPVAADALVVDAPPSGTVQAYLFHLTEEKAPGDPERVQVALASGSTAERWSARLLTGTRIFDIERRSLVIDLTDAADGSTLRLPLLPPDRSGQAAAAELKAAYARAVERYPPRRELLHYRNRVAALGLALWLATEVMILALASVPAIVNKRTSRPFNLAFVTICIGFAYYLHFQYFR